MAFSITSFFCFESNAIANEILNIFLVILWAELWTLNTCLTIQLIVFYSNIHLDIYFDLNARSFFPLKENPSNTAMAFSLSSSLPKLINM